MSIFDNEPGRGSQNSQIPQLPKGTMRLVAIGAIVFVLLWIGLTSVYTVQEQERAAVLTFGKYTGETTAGLQFKFPYPIQQVIKVPAQITQKIQIGYRENNGQTISVPEESLMITGDENIISADAVVEWRIENVQNYLFNINGEPDTFLSNAASSAIRSVLGATKLDYAITDGKTEVQLKVKEKLDEINKLYNTGIFVIDIKFQDIEPPEGEVQQAFKDVTNAREEKNTKINNAKKYENDVIPRARGDAQAILENANAVKKARVLNAQGDVAKFNAIYTEYAKSPNVTKDRLILETLEKILPNAKIFITDSSGSTVNYLNLNDLLKPKGGTTP